MNQRGWSLSSFIGFAAILLIFVLIIVFNVMKLNNLGVVEVADTSNGAATMKGENKFTSYADAEKAVVDSLKAYKADKYKRIDIESSIIVTVKELISGGYLKNTYVNSDKCSGYGIVSKNGSSYSYESYLKCGSYSTPGYTSSLDK